LDIWNNYKLEIAVFAVIKIVIFGKSKIKNNEKILI